MDLPTPELKKVEDLLHEVVKIVQSEGLVYLGVVKLERMEQDMTYFTQWLAEGRHGEMMFLTQNLSIRQDPRRLLEDARTAIIVGLSYAQGDKTPRPYSPPRIAQYARLRDYHRVLRKKGLRILSKIQSECGNETIAGRVVTDSAPLFERSLAARTGRGFIGKNTCFISVDHGSFLLLGEILTSLDLPASNPENIGIPPGMRSKAGGCGSCRRCQVHCPTGALDQDYRIDARKCIAYWTIEHRGPIPEDFWPWVGRYLFGCDICQIVCPYNRQSHHQAAHDLIKITETPPLYQIATMTQEDYERLFGGTPMTRAKRSGLIRNALIAMTVRNDPRLLEAIAFVKTQPMDPAVEATLSQINHWIHRRT